MPTTYRGTEAVEMAAKKWKMKTVDPIAAHIIEEEGFVDGEYKDDVEITTWGVGQTGDHIGRDFFREVLPEYQNKAATEIKGWATFSEDAKKHIVSAYYRGDIGPKTKQLLSAGQYLSAAREYLNHDEYKKRKKKNPEDGVVKRMQGNAEAMKRMAAKND